jgi:hypothetical protein
MNRLTQWLDQAVERICEWLNGILPGDHQLVVAGYGLAGLQKGFLLPVDRRLNPSVLHMSYKPASHSEKMTRKAALEAAVLSTIGGYVDKARKYKMPPPSALEDNCGFWAYCHISGVPCQKCRPASVVGSINFLDPTQSNGSSQCDRLGKMDGTAWWGCCKNPSGQIRLIGFSDCCSSGYPAPQDCGGSWDTAKCENWPDAKDWCFNTVEGKNKQTMEASGKKATYYCTIVLDQGECPT